MTVLIRKVHFMTSLCFFEYFMLKKFTDLRKGDGGILMENEQLFEVGETYAFKSDLFESPIKGKIEKIYENSVMIRVMNCAAEDNDTAHNLHWQLVVRKSSTIEE